MKIGVRIPSYVWPDGSFADVGHLGGYARRAEMLGFESIWVVDHLLVAPPVYRVAWLDPLMVLACVAACTERVKLGTAALVAALRHPVTLAKEVASLAVLADGRLILGLATGWYRPEFDALGLDPGERGRRTDEILNALPLLLANDAVSFDGRYYSFRDVTLVPRPAEPPPIWIAGGSATDPSSGESRIPKAVLERIVRQDGWLAGSSGRPEDGMRRDWMEIGRAASSAGRDLGSLVFAHTQFLHLVEGHDSREVLREQEQAFRRVVGRDRSFAELQADYLFGTTEEIAERIAEMAELGVQHLILTPVTSHLAQLELIADQLLSPYLAKVSASPVVRRHEHSPRSGGNPPCS